MKYANNNKEQKRIKQQHKKLQSIYYKITNNAHNYIIKKQRKISAPTYKMRKLINSLFFNPELKKLEICTKHLPKNKQGKLIQSINQPMAYKSDHCSSCHQYYCLICSQHHVNSHCVVQLGTYKDLGEGVLRNLNLGEVVKLDFQRLKCICGKGIGPGAAICAACGMFSCSEKCHQHWEEQGNCKFNQNFYSVPQGFTMRSILYENVKKIQDSNVKQWAITNRSSTSMLCCYAMGATPFVYLQRGYRIYGKPNPQLISLLQPTTRNLDYYIHFERRCDCTCQACETRSIHSSTNCQIGCKDFDLEYMKNALMKGQCHRQCTCNCQFCQSGIIFNTHRYLDCMMFCKRSNYWVQRNQGKTGLE